MKSSIIRKRCFASERTQSAVTDCIVFNYSVQLQTKEKESFDRYELSAKTGSSDLFNYSECLERHYRIVFIFQLRYLRSTLMRSSTRSKMQLSACQNLHVMLPSRTPAWRRYDLFGTVLNLLPTDHRSEKVKFISQ